MGGLRDRIQQSFFLALPLYALYNYWQPGFPLSERAIVALLAVSTFFLGTPSRTRLGRGLDCVHLALGLVVFG